MNDCWPSRSLLQVPQVIGLLCFDILLVELRRDTKLVGLKLLAYPYLVRSFSVSYVSTSFATNGSDELLFSPSEIASHTSSAMSRTSMLSPPLIVNLLSSKLVRQ